MIYAQITDNVIQNTIVLDDSGLLSLFTQGFDMCMRIDNLDPQPGIGWSYDGRNFNPPPPEPDPETED